LELCLVSTSYAVKMLQASERHAPSDLSVRTSDSEVHGCNEGSKPPKFSQAGCTGTYVFFYRLGDNQTSQSIRNSKCRSSPLWESKGRFNQTLNPPVPGSTWSREVQLGGYAAAQLWGKDRLACRALCQDRPANLLILVSCARCQYNVPRSAITWPPCAGANLRPEPMPLSDIVAALLL
jgi:hypothetical protein